VQCANLDLPHHIRLAKVAGAKNWQTVWLRRYHNFKAAGLAGPCKVDLITWGLSNPHSPDDALSFGTDGAIQI
jgi:hypothetical protein